MIFVTNFRANDLNPSKGKQIEFNKGVIDTFFKFSNPEEDYIVVEVTKIDENGVKGMMVYPNPAKDMLNITAENMRRITISNVLGQIVYDREVNSDNEIINMSQYEAGIYMVRITTETGSVVRKVSKQ